MSKVEFLKELEGLLQDISSEERESAIKYYEDYFEDAGPDSEEILIDELGTPTRVATIIKDGLKDLQNQSDAGEYTENGYIDNSEKKEKFEVLNEAQSDDSNNGNQYSNNNNTKYNYSNNNYKENKSNDKDNRKESKVILIILLCLFGIPIGLPLIFTAFGLIISIFATVICLFFSFILVAVALLIAAIVLISVGFTQIAAAPAAAAVLVGVGLIILGVGFICGIFSIWLFIKVVPAFFNWIAELCRKLFHRNKEEAR